MPKENNLKKHLIALQFIIIFSSCTFRQEGGTTVESQSNIKYAKGFSIENHEHYKKLTILNPWNNFKPYATYTILKDSTIPPNSISEGLNFYFNKTPQTIALHTAAQATALKVLQLENQVIGITDPRFFYDSSYLFRLNSGEIIQTSNQVQINKERLIVLKPDILITSGWNAINSDYQQLIKLKIPPLFMIEWMETNPLGRAEWIKVIGLLFDKEREADSLFNLVETNYLHIRNENKNRKDKPKILHGEEYSGVWYVAGGQSYIANIYRDAGAEYLWESNQKTGSLTVDVEVVLEKGANANFWITTFSQNKNDIEHIKQSKYQLIKAVKENAVYSNTNRTRVLGGNDFWETGNLRPDLILKDIVGIIHEEKMSFDSLYFYKRLDLK